MRPYTRSLQFAKPYWKLLALGFFFTFLIFVISLIPPFFTKILIDNVLMSRNVELLKVLFFGIIILFILDLFIGLVNHLIFVKAGQKISYDVRVCFFRHLQKLPMGFYDSRRTGDLIYRLFRDTESVPVSVSTVPVDFALHLLTIIIVSGILLTLNWNLSLLCFMIVPLHTISIVGFRKRIIRWSQRLREKDEAISGNVVEYFSCIRMVKAFGAESKELAQFRQDQEERMRLELRSILTSKVSSLTTSSINNFLFFLVLWYGGFGVIKGSMTLGDLMAFSILIGRLYTPVSAITNIVLGLQDSMVGMRRVFEVLDLPPYENGADAGTSEDGKESLTCVRGDLEFRNVWFSYNGVAPALRDVSFKANAGQRIAFVGRSGAGKTTAVNLLAGFYQPQMGSILVDGHDIRAINMDSLRKHIGIVLQDAYLFSGSVRDNILYGLPSAGEDELIKASKQANIHDFIISLPEGYGTKVGERGVRLSGGQKQRIAIARAFLRNPSILILDEAMSSVDLESEALIQSALQELMQNRTCVIVAHRFSTIKSVDKIVVLESGTVMEQGSHTEVMKEKGLYYYLFEQLAKV